MCTPAAGDSACVQCAKKICCADYTACAADTNCTCWAACYQANPGNYTLCNQMCGAPDTQTQNIATCTTGTGPCANVCP
jgi:hypothetical protein